MIKLGFRYFAAFALLLLSLNFQSQGKSSTPAVKTQPLNQSNQSASFVSKDKGFSISFPKDWFQKEGFMGTAIIALRPSNGPKDDFRENVNVVTEDLPKPWTLKDYTDANIANMGKLLTDFKQVERETTILDGVPAERLVYTHRMGMYTLQVLVYLSVKGKRGYVITSTSLPDRFSQWRKTFEGIAKTFKYV